jgi:hypothetical protein
VGGDCGSSLPIHEQAAQWPKLRVFRHRRHRRQFWCVLVHRSKQVYPPLYTVLVPRYVLYICIACITCINVPITTDARLPGLESSSNNKEDEDVMYDEMMTVLLSKVLRSHPSFVASGCNDGLWECVRDVHAVVPSSAAQEACTVAAAAPSKREEDTWINLLKWRAFTRKNRHRVQVQAP